MCKELKNKAGNSVLAIHYLSCVLDSQVTKSASILLNIEIPGNRYSLIEFNFPSEYSESGLN
jgi:hypothetical protein